MAGITRKKDSSWIPNGFIVLKSGNRNPGSRRSVHAVRRRLERSRRLVNKTLESKGNVVYLNSSTILRNK